MREMTEAYGELALRALAAVVKATEGHVRTGESVQRMAEGASSLSEQSAAGLAKVLEIKAAEREMELEHEAEMARQERWDGVWEKIGTPFAMELAGLLRDTIRNARGKDTPATLPDELRALRDKAGDRWGGVLAAMTEDERDVINAMLAESDETKFLALYVKFREFVHPRLEAFGEAVGNALGQDLVGDFMAFLARVDARAD
jgi:hypothetical protein